MDDDYYDPGAMDGGDAVELLEPDGLDDDSLYFEDLDDDSLYLDGLDDEGEPQQPALTQENVAELLDAVRDAIFEGANQRIDEVFPAQYEEVPEYAAQIHGNLALVDVVNNFGEQPELAHLKGVDPKAVIEHAQEIAPMVFALVGESDEAAAKALWIAAEHVASVQHGEKAIIDEIDLRNLHFANGRMDPRMIRYAAESALARAERARGPNEAPSGPDDAVDAIREGFRLAGGNPIAKGQQLVGYYTQKAKQIREQSGLSTEAKGELHRLHGQLTGADTALHGKALVAKYAKEAQPHRHRDLLARAARGTI